MNKFFRENSETYFSNKNVPIKWDGFGYNMRNRNTKEVMQTPLKLRHNAAEFIMKIN